MSKFINLKGQRFERLLVKELVSLGKYGALWQCECDCGKVKNILSNSLRSNHTKSCGCYNNDLRKSRVNELNGFFSHGKSNTREYHRDWETKKRLNKNYSLSLEDYNNLYKKQNGVCAICSRVETRLHPAHGRMYSLLVDHDHKTGKVRGLLCHHCNLVLGHAKDETLTLKNAITYLEGQKC